MSGNIVEDVELSFKELEQKVFRYVCMLGCEITQKVLEDYDKKLHNERDKKVYRDKGKRTTSIKTVYGDVTYSRCVYRTKTEAGEITSSAFRRSTDGIKESIYAGHHVLKRPRAWRLISLLCERKKSISKASGWYLPERALGASGKRLPA